MLLFFDIFIFLLYTMACVIFLKDCSLFIPKESEVNWTVNSPLTSIINFNLYSIFPTLEIFSTFNSPNLVFFSAYLSFPS